MRQSLSKSISMFVLLVFGIFLITLVPPILTLGRGVTAYLEFGSSVTNTMVANCLALLISILSMRRFERYPQRNPIAFILPVTATVFGVLMSVFLILRIDYSVKIIAIAGLITPVFLGVQHLLGDRIRNLNFLVVPFGDALNLQSSKHYRFSKLIYPELPFSNADGLVVDFKCSELTPEWEFFISEAAVSGLQVFSATHLSEAISGRVDIKHLMENNFGVLAPSPVLIFLKRVIDIIVVVASAPLVISICLVTSLFICYESPGGPFFRQERVGFRGKPFTILKFRSMYVSEHSQDTVSDLEHDRISGVGKIIRKYRIDELPQFWNVLMGDLSLIGPRPETIAWTEKYRQEIPFYFYRNILRPGITGWAQVMQGHVHGVGDTSLKLEYDFYYLKHFSLWLDLLILYKTIRTVLMASGSR